jgi:mucin-19
MKKLILFTLLAVGLIGSAGAQIYTVQQITSSGSFVYPHVGDIDSNGTIFVGDLYSIHSIDTLGTITKLAGGSSTGYLDGKGGNALFSGLGALVLDSQTNVWVADNQNNSIRLITPAGLVTTIAGNGTAGFSNATGTNAIFNQPAGIALDTAGNAYVSDSQNHCIRKISTNGIVTTLAGNGQSGFVDGYGANARFLNPEGSHIGPDGSLYVADTDNNAIRKISLIGEVTTLAGKGSPGYVDSTGTNATFNQPNDVTTDAVGNVYVSDFWNFAIRKISSRGVVSTVVNNLGFCPAGIAIDSLGTIYTADYWNGNIYKIIPPYPPLTFTSQPNNVSLAVTNGQTAAFSVVATNGVPPYAYQWMKDGVDLTNQTNASLVLSNAAANTVGYYSCDVTDQTGTTVTSSNAALNINGVPFYLWQGLVGYYPLQTNPNDLSGYGNDINLSNLNFTNTGSNNFGKYCRFNQTNSYFYQSSGKLNVASSMTLSFWAKAINAENLYNQHISGKDQYPSHNYVIFPNYYGYSSGLGVAVGTNGVSVVEHGYDYLPSVLTYSNAIGLNWNHIVVLTDNNDAPSLYINGKFVAKGLQSGRDKYFSFPHDQSIIDTAVGSGNYQGGVTDFRIYNRALSSNEVSALCLAEAPVPTNKQTITFPAIPSKSYGTAPFSLTASSSAGSNYSITYSSSDSNVATVSSNTVTITGVGSCLITASQPGDFIYKAATNVSRTLTVTKASQTITFTSPSAQTFGNGSFTLLATASSGLTVSFTSGNTNVATISSNTVTIKGAGTVSITARQAGNTNYNAAISVAKTLTVAKAAPTINFNPTTPVTYIKGATFPLTATATSAGSISFVSGDTSILSIVGKTATMKAKGTVSVTASAAATSNYNAASTNAIITLQ